MQEEDGLKNSKKKKEKRSKNEPSLRLEICQMVSQIFFPSKNAKSRHNEEQAKAKNKSKQRKIKIGLKMADQKNLSSKTRSTHSLEPIKTTA